MLALLLLPVVALTALLVGKVLAQLRGDAKERRAGTSLDRSLGALFVSIVAFVIFVPAVSPCSGTVCVVRPGIK